MDVYKQPSKEAAIELLTQCELPTCDLNELDFDYFLAMGQDSKMQGVVGSEVYGEIALLRSLAVAPESRSLGVAKKLVKALEVFLLKHGVTSIYLLTESAEHFFTGLGYVVESREQAPVSIQNTKQFSGLCPGSAVFMCKKIKVNGN